MADASARRDVLDCHRAGAQKTKRCETIDGVLVGSNRHIAQ
jgi:hypothetical protein